MFVTNWISTTKIQKISEITNFFRHYFLSRTEVFHRMRMKMPRLDGSYVAAGAFSKKTVRDIIGRLEIACGK